MKFFLLFTVVFAIFCTWSDASCSTWFDRMSKYGKLTNCKYYVTSESQYKNFIPYHHNERGMSESHLMKLRFFTLAQKTFRIMLTGTKHPDFTESTTPSSTTEYPQTTTHRPYPTNDPAKEPAKEPSMGLARLGPLYAYYHDNQDESTYPSTTDVPTTTTTWFPSSSTVVPPSVKESYEIVIGSEVEYNGSYPPIKYVESFVRNSKERITTLRTPGIVRNDEPNEVVVEIFKDGNMKITVNRVDEIFAQLEYINHLKYFSFAADTNNQREEFFYYCYQD